MELFDFINVVGLNSLYNEVVQKWIGPLMLIAVAVFAIVFIKDRAWMKLISFVGIAAVVAVLIYAGPALFGNNGKTAGVSKVAENLAGKVGKNAP